jgi:hypothetical protein
MVRSLILVFIIFILVCIVFFIYITGGNYLKFRLNFLKKELLSIINKKEVK